MSIIDQKEIGIDLASLFSLYLYVPQGLVFGLIVHGLKGRNGKLENEEYNTIIVAGDSPLDSNARHAWMLVETSDGKYMPVEATTYSVVLWSSAYFDNYFIYAQRFETIEEALGYSHTEFDWWE